MSDDPLPIPQTLAVTGRDPTHFAVTREQLVRLVGGGVLAAELVETFIRKEGLATKPATLVASMLQHRSIDLDRVAEVHRGDWLDLRLWLQFQERGAILHHYSLVRLP